VFRTVSDQPTIWVARDRAHPTNPKDRCQPRSRAYSLLKEGNRFVSENPQFVASAAVDKLRTRLLPKAAQFYLEKAKGHNDGASLYQDIDETELSGARLQDEAVIELDIAANDATSSIKQQISEALRP
jgi:hypothetical protein